MKTPKKPRQRVIHGNESQTITPDNLVRPTPDAIQTLVHDGKRWKRVGKPRKAK